MGSTESTDRSNGTEEEEEEHQPKNSISGGGSMGAGTAVALAATDTVMAAWEISRMISGSSDSKNKEEDESMKINAHEKESSFSNFPIHESLQYEAEGKLPKSIWSPPPVGCFKMNTHGGCPHLIIEGDGVQRGLDGYAGILRNDCGIWVRCFQGSFNGVTTDSLTTELHGIHKGLKLLAKLKLKGSILESDCEAAVKWVNRRDEYRGTNPIIEDCWDIIKESRQLALENNIDVEHIIGEDANQCADKLADIAAKTQGVYLYKELIYLPSEIRLLYDKDKMSLNREIYPSIYEHGAIYLHPMFASPTS